jgi:TP901 family phage tail tape measure protein
MDHLSIRILSKLNEELSIKEINKQLKSIEKQIHSLYLTAKIDKNAVKGLSKEFSKEKINLDIDVNKESVNKVQETIKDTKQKISKKNKIELFEFDDSELRQKFDSINEAFQAVEKTFNGSKPKVTQFITVDDDTEKIKKFTLQVEEADKAIHKLQFALDENGSYFLKSRELVDRQAESLEKLRKEEERLAEQIAKKRESADTKRRQEELKLLENQQKAIQKNIEREQQLREKAIEEESKIRLAIAKKNEELRHSLELYKKQAEINAMNLRRRYGDDVDEQALQKYLKSVKELSLETPDLRKKMDHLNMSFKEIRENVQSSSSHVLSFGEALKTALVKFPVWLVSGTIIMQTINFFQEGIRYVNELSNALNEIAIVTGKTQQEVEALGMEYQKLAYEMGVLTQDITKASVEFYRQGLSQEEIMKRVQITTQYAKISALDFKKAAEILTATVNSMNVDIERASDVFAYLGDATATGADEIGRAFQRLGGTAGAVGIGFEKASSWIAVVSSRTRESAETIGNGIKSILARIQQLREKGFTEEDNTNVNQVAKALNEVGIQLLDQQGNFRNFGDVMDELGAKWNSLTSRQKAYLATTIAGTYQQSRFLNLMEGYSDSVKLYEEALNAANTTQEKFNIYQQSTEAYLNRLKTSFTGLWQETFDSDIIRTAIEGMTSFVNVVRSVNNTVGSLPILFGAVGASVILFNKDLMKTMLTMNAFKANVFTMRQGLSLLTISFQTLGVAAKSTFAFLSRAALPIAAFMALGSAISWVTNKIAENRAEAKQFKQENEKIIDSYINQKTEIDSLLSRFNALNSIKDRTNEQEQEYLDVQNKLGQLMPNLISHIDEYGQTHIKVGDALENELQYAKELVEVYRTDLANAYKERFEEALKAQADAQREADRIQNQLNRTGQHGGILGDVSILSDAQRRGLEFQLRAFQRDVANAKEDIKRQVGEMITEILKLNNVEIDDNLSNQIQEFVKSFDVSDLNADEIAQKAQHFSDSLANLQEQIRSGNEEAIEDAKEELISFAASMGMTDEKAQEFIGTLFEQAGAQDLVNQATAEGAEEQENLAEKYNNAISTIQSLNGVLNELNEGHGLSGDKIGFLLENYPHLLSYLGDETALREAIQQEIANEEKIAKQVILAKLSYQEQFYNNVIKANAQFVNEFKDKYGIDLTNFKNLAQAKLAVDNKLRQEMTKAWNAYFRSVDERLRKQEIAYPEVDLKYRALKFKEQQYVEAQNTFEGIFMDSITATVGTSISSSGSKKPSTSKSKSSGGGRKSSTSSSDRENIYVADKFKQALEKLNLEIEKQQKLREKYPEYATEYRNSLEKEIKLENERKKLLQERYDELQKQIKLGKIQQTGVFDPNAEVDSAKALEEIDKAKSELLDLQQEILKSENMIAELETQLAFSTFEVFNEQREDLTQVYQNGENRLKRLSKTSEEYRNELEKQIDVLKRKQQINEKEMQYIKELIASGKLNVETVEELTDRLHELGLETNSLIFQQQELLYEKVQSVAGGFAELIDDIDYRIDRSNAIMQMYTKGSEEYIKEIQYQIPLMEEKANLILEERNALLELLKTEDLSAEQKKEILEQLEDLSVEYWQTNAAIKQYKDTLNEVLIVESLQKQKNTYLEGLRKESEEIVENLEKQIENTENYYDQLIEAQKERLDLLEDEYELEDRLQRLREIDEEIRNVKNDKRFSYITADGQEILTFDKARVSELEKERNELLKQYQREDIKKAIQDEIDRLEKAKREKIDILNKEVEETRRKYDELIEQEEMKWDELITAAQNGTLTFDELMNGWYGSSLETLKQYGIDVQTEVNKIKEAFESLGQIQIPEATQLPSANNQNNNNNQSSSSQSSTDLSNAKSVKSTNGRNYYKMERPDGSISWVIDRVVQDKIDDGYKLVPYHDGGIVGGAKSKLQKLANTLFNDKLKPNETIVKSLVGELQIPPHNIPNIVHNIGSIVSSMIPKSQQTVVQNHYSFPNMQVKANNIQEFLRSIDFIINSNQS